MLKIIIKYLLIFLVSILVVNQFPGFIDKIKLIPTGLLKIIFPEKKIRPLISNNNESDNSIKKLKANSFEVNIVEIDYFSGFNIDQDGKINNQHKSAALYGKHLNNETILELYTRDGFLIKKENISQFNLPKNYDSHNSQGGIRGIFFIEEEPYAFMAAKKIGCQYMSIFNLNKKIEIFQTDCLPDNKKIHFDGIGGASVHNKNDVLLSIGTPSNSSQTIRDLAQNDESYYGKIVSIDKESVLESLDNSDVKARVKIFTKGHRNPQGLAKINDKFFSAEHGPRGGDEINILEQDGNYGWPIASYGTKYEKPTIKSYELNHLKNNLIEPLIQFTPSIAISSLVKCTKQMIKYFDREGCLLATTLKDQSLVIVLLSKDFKRIIGYERIKFDERLRHFAKGQNGELFSENDGSFYVTADSGKVLKISFKLTKE